MKEHTNASSIRDMFKESFDALGITDEMFEEEKFEMNLPKLDHTIELQLSQDGLEIEDGLQNKNMSMSCPHQYFLYQKRPVLVYIRDQFLESYKYQNNRFNPFHICFCSQLQTAKKENRYKNRYIVTYNQSGNFLVNITVREKNKYGGIVNERKEDNVRKNLRVCQNCLYDLNWDRFQDHCIGTEWWHGPGGWARNQIVQSFSIKEFLSKVKHSLINGDELYNVSTAPKKQYDMKAEWKERLKAAHGYKCDECHFAFTSSMLQIHHIDHNEGNNSNSNLAVVCAECHKRIHRQEGGYIGDD